ncbi:MAG: DMT family transporter [Tissierellia bacterium]|nr:DMT family transporter [Tissierellia bacterium]
MSKTLRSNLMLLITAMIWGAAFVAQVSGMDHLGTFTFNFCRNIIAGVTLLLVLYFWPKIFGKPLEPVDPSKRKSTIRGGVACGAALFFAMSFQQLGIQFGATAGKAGFITALYIIIVPLLGIFLGKKVGLRLWACVALGAVGLYLLTMRGDSLRMNLGDFLILICAVLYSGHILVIDHYSPKSNGVAMSMIQFFVAAVLSAIVMIFAEKVSWEAIVNGALPILYAGVLSSGVGYTFQILVQKDTDPTIASLLMSLESVFAVLAGALLLGERLTSREAIGCIIMFAAIVIAQLPSRKKAVN